MTRRELLAAPALMLQGRKRPNIVFLLSDDQRWNTLGCMGNSIVRTPNIDGLSKRGVTFEKHFVTTSICVTSRSSIFTGQYARCHGIQEFGAQFTPEQFSKTYPALLRGAGYRTGFIGKWGLDKPPVPKEQFDYWAGFLGQGKYFPQGEPGPHLNSIMTDQAREFLGGSKGKEPFCLSLSFKAPHVQDEDPRQYLPESQDAALYKDVQFPEPKTAAPRYISQLPLFVQRSESRRRWAFRFSTPELFQTSMRNYYGLISGVDRAVGNIVSELDKLGLRENTIIVYTGDNGYLTGEHGLSEKFYMYEESIRVPCIAQGPGVQAGRRVNGMTLNVDFAPTFCDLAGLKTPDSMQGRPLTPLLAGQSPAWRKDWFYEFHTRTNAWIPFSEGIRTDRWKYFQWQEGPTPFEELYDLQTDPLEETNLAARREHGATLESLRKRRLEWIDALDQGRVPD